MGPWVLDLDAVDVAGLFFGPYAPLARTVVQHQVPAGLRGRVLGIRTSITGAGAPAGSLIAGWMLQMMQPSAWIGVTGTGILFIAGAMLASRRVRTME